MTIQLEEILKSTWMKAAMSVRGLQENISDSMVIKLFHDLHMMAENPLLYKQVMRSVHGVDVDDITPDPLMTEFYKLVTNEVMGALTAEDVKWDELEIYHYGLGRNLIALSKLISENVIRKDQARDALKLLMSPLYIGVDFEDFLTKDGATVFVDADNSELDKIIDEAIAANAKAVSEFKNGKEKALMSVVGFVMKKIKTDPKQLLEAIKAKI